MGRDVRCRFCQESIFPRFTHATKTRRCNNTEFTIQDGREGVHFQEDQATGSVNFINASARIVCLALSTGKRHVDWKCFLSTKPPSRPNLQQYLKAKPFLLTIVILAAQNFPSAQMSILDPFRSFASARIEAANRSWPLASFTSAAKNIKSRARLHNDMKLLCNMYSATCA